MTEDPRSTALEALTDAPDYHLHSLELSAAAMYSGVSIEAVREALAERSDLPRRLTIEEEAALRFAIQCSDSEDAAAFLAQVPYARVRGYCGCGCATIEMEISDPDAPRASETHPPLGSVSVIDEEGEMIGELTVFVLGGLLHTLELVDRGDGPIAPMPPLERLRVQVAR